MLIYTILEYNYGDVDLELATTNKDEALKKFKEDPQIDGYYYVLQIWSNEKRLVEIFFDNHKYKASYASYLFENEKQMCSEILERLK